MHIPDEVLNAVRAQSKAASEDMCTLVIPCYNWTGGCSDYAADEFACCDGTTLAAPCSCDHGGDGHGCEPIFDMPSLLRVFLWLGWFVCLVLGYRMDKHQVARQLRRPPLLGVWATRHRHPIQMGLAASVLVGVFNPLGLRMTDRILNTSADWESADSNTQTTAQTEACASASERSSPCVQYSPSALSYMISFLVGLLLVRAVAYPITSAYNAAVERASLCSIVGRLRLDIGDTDGANAIFATAQTELERMTKRKFRQFWTQENTGRHVRMGTTVHDKMVTTSSIDPNCDPELERLALRQSESKDDRWWCCCCCPVGVVIFFVVWVPLAIYYDIV